jgi:hypothetical protein
VCLCHTTGVAESLFVLAATRSDVTLRSTPTTLDCAACGDTVTDTGYLPATESDDGYEPSPADAVCGACGFTAVGMTGCAPELGDVTDPEAADTLLCVRATDDGVEVVRSKT